MQQRHQTIAAPTGSAACLPARAARYEFAPQPARMVGDYKGAAVDPGVAAWLRSAWFADSNTRIAALLQRTRPGGMLCAWP